MNLTLSKLLSRSLVAAVAFALCAIPAVASAEPGPGDGPDGPSQVRKGKRGKGAKRNRPSFPMEGERFVGLVSNRVQKMKARIDRALERRNVPPELQKEIKADFSKASTRIMGAAEKAAADGTVTKQEAQKVRQLAKQLRQQARQKYGKMAKKNRGKDRKKNGPASHGKRGPGAKGRPANF
ncbi:MAG: hypothetical protein JRI23_10605 [Deltaproteobacteria bacterium]|nr:hypothetical protein [Deltaproteobacteria bacterium]MBW2532127.1 hypothetical protein [Deltaproteobacteria bacterium]